jgi:hypothetical protein
LDTPNAFIGIKDHPTAQQLATALGPSVEIWDRLVQWLAGQGASRQEWKSTSAKYGWSLRLKSKNRTIVYLGPCQGCFRTAFVLGDKAVAAARAAGLPKPILKAIDEAPRYAEGTGVRLLVQKAADLQAIQQLARIKMEH